MSKTPSVTPKELIKLLEQKRFVLDRSKGSHQIYFNKEKEFACCCSHTQQRFAPRNFACNLETSRYR